MDIYRYLNFILILMGRKTGTLSLFSLTKDDVHVLNNSRLARLVSLAKNPWIISNQRRTFYPGF